MVLKKDQERIKLLLKDTITLLCKNGLTFKNEFSIEATIGITLDQDEVVLVSINELIKSELGAAKLLDSSEIEVRNSKDNGDRHETDSRPGSVSPTTGRRRKRRRSRNTMSNTDQSNDYESFDEDNTSHTSDLEPPMKKMQSDIKIEAEGDSDDLVFVKQEIDAGDWMPIDEHGHGGGGTEQEQDSFHGSFPGSSQENSDFLQGSMEQLMAGQSGSPNRMPRRTATVTSNSTPGRSNSQWMYQEDACADPAVPLHLGEPPHYQGAKVTSRSSGGGTQQDDLFCSICRKFYINRKGLKMHMLRHEGKFPYLCQICGKGFAHKNNLQGHMVQHTNAPEFACQWCGQQFSYKQNWLRHVKKVHPDKRDQ